MSFINDFLQELKRETKISINLRASRVNLLYNDEADILSKVLPFKCRLDSSQSYIQFCTNTGHFIVSFQIQEFPSCCGKAIVNSLGFNSRFSYGDAKFEFTREQTLNIIHKMFVLISNCVERLGYSSYDFILSDVDNPLIYKFVEEYKIFESTATWKNRRNRYEHVCKNYTVNLRQISPVEEEELIKQESEK